MENVDTEQPTSSSEIPSNAAPVEATPNPIAEETQQPSKDTTQKDNGDGHDVLTVESGAKKEESAAAANPPLEHSAPANSSSSNHPPTTSTPSYALPVKRFSAVSVNKKFLEKSSTHVATTGVSQAAATVSASKTTGTIARPAPQSASSHLRLVTSKVPGNPLLSTSPGPGWSRPQSVTPPAHSPSNQTPPSGSHGQPGAPHMAVPGRSALKSIADGGVPTKPAWRNVSATPKLNIGSQSEFPTAAEAAKGDKAKSEELRAAQAAAHEAAVAHQQALTETADAFRGVHLAAKGHWDEMEEEDDNDFLGGVIEFGDGTQYTIKVNDGTIEPNGVGGSRRADGSANKEERFADDFDRSWPRSSEPVTQADANPQRRSSSETSSNVPHSPVAPRDSSHPRVLFNERLNRLEPAGSRSEKREHPDARGRAMDKSESSLAGSRSQVLLLQKSSQSSSVRSDEAGHPGSSPTDIKRDDAFETASIVSQSSDGLPESRRAWGQRSGFNHRPNVPDSKWINNRRDPSTSRDTSSVASSLSNHDTGRPTWGNRSGLHHNEPSLRAGRESERQLPPHLSRSPIDTRKESPWAKPPSVLPKPEQPPEQPAPASNDPEPANCFSPAVEKHEHDAPAKPLEVPDVNELQKAVLQTSAERAKKRRQEEEEERARAQERARKKAAELEARMLASTAPKAPPPVQPSIQNTKPVRQDPQPGPLEEEVNKIIEEAISTSKSSEEVQPSEPTKHSDVPTRHQPASDRIVSWRSKTSVVTQTIAVPDTREVAKQGNVEVKSAAFITGGMESLDFRAGENLEVVSFEDMGKLMQEAPSSPSKHPSRRPVASDFFEDNTSRSDAAGQWRKATDSEVASAAVQPQGAVSVLAVDTDILVGNPTDSTDNKPTSIDLPPQTSDFNSINGQHIPSSPRLPKSPLQAYREAPLSALDDTMSRIKGALDGMHSGMLTGRDSNGAVSHAEIAQDVSGAAHPQLLKAEKWVGPAKRPAVPITSMRTPDDFSVSAVEPSFELRSSSAKPDVTLPKVLARKIMIPSKKHPHILKSTTCYVRWDILSFDPPVEGMTKKSLSLNDVLFRRPQGMFKKSFRHTVVLPKSNGIQRFPSLFPPQPGQPPIRVNLASGVSRPFSTLKSGRNGAVEMNWRSSQTISSSSRQESSKAELNVTSRSPPPEPMPLQDADSTPQGRKSTADASMQPPPPAKPKGPQMPAGASIAFYRSARDSIDKSSARKVSFTVSSELDGISTDNTDILLSKNKVDAEVVLEQDTSKEITTVSSETESRVVSTAFIVSPSPASDDSDDQESDGIQTKIVARSAISVLSEPSTPPPSNPSSNSSWKSPARAPDPELLKAVWSQPSGKVHTPTVNSLKAIADDLTAVPFSLSDVKSDDGETPPPTSSQPSRMSASEVTKAFQMVPPAPAGTMSPASGRGTLFAPAVTSPLNAAKALKPANTGHSHPPANGVVRPPYGAYPHMAAHTPSPPTIMYPHQMAPNGMQHSPSGTPYGQPVWVPMGPPMHQGAPMVRGQPGAPYNPSLLPYHTPGAAQNGMYPPPSMHPTSQGQAGGYPGMPPSQMMVSPVMTHAAPVPPHMMYGASPVLLPVPAPGAPPQPSAYPGAVGMGRAPVPVRNPSDTRPTPTSAASSSRFNGHTYGQAPSQPFVRPTW